MSDVLDPRDGPTTDWKQHHDVVRRSSGLGERKLSRLEQLLVTRYISPEQSEAGRRFARDYLICFGGGGRSSLDLRPRGTGGWNPSEAREDASKAYAAAKQVLDNGGFLALAPGVNPSSIMVRCCVEDESFNKLAERLSVGAELAKSMVAQCFTVLAMHYAAVDRRIGKSSTAQTYEAALANFDPDAQLLKVK